MAWIVETSDEFDRWWDGLDGDTQDSLAVLLRLLQKDGPNLPRPYADKLHEPDIDLRELRRTVYGQSNEKHVYRILYAFDPLRNAFLCLAETRETTNGGTGGTSLAQRRSSRRTWRH